MDRPPPSRLYQTYTVLCTALFLAVVTTVSDRHTIDEDYCSKIAPPILPSAGKYPISRREKRPPSLSRIRCGRPIDRPVTGEVRHGFLIGRGNVMPEFEIRGLQVGLRAK